ncbi:MAG: hypothetical protein P4L83_10245 [Nevskia sp.]|nr:hypothetical protein [Nevskia sp.]
MNARFAAPAVSLAALVLAGCGSNHCDFCDADPSGIYEGSATDTTTQKSLPAVAVIDENGDGRMLVTNGDYYRLSLGTSGDSLYGSFLAFPGNHTTFSGSLSGQVTQPGLSATLAAQGQDTQNLSLNFDNIYLYSSSLPTLAGNWSLSTTGYSLTLTIQASGAVSGSDTTGCTYNGFFSLVDPNFNAYSETFTQVCGATSINYSGLSYYIPASGSGTNATPAMIDILADDNNGHFVSALVH